MLSQLYDRLVKLNFDLVLHNQEIKKSRKYFAEIRA